MSKKKTTTHKSHFVPYAVVELAEDKRLERPLTRQYSDGTRSRVKEVLDSPYNISETSAAWNLGENRRRENQIVRHFRGDLDWTEMSKGAQQRFAHQQVAWEDIRDGMKRAAPSLAKELDKFYRPRGRR